MEMEFLSVDVLDVYQENNTKEKIFIISNAELYSDRKWFRAVVFRNENGNVYVMQINEFLNNHTKL
jgi:hypothetical protein